LFWAILASLSGFCDLGRALINERLLNRCSGCPLYPQ
jgi:hypothetical protein